MRSAVGIVGLGIMGSAIADHLVRAGYSVAGYDVLARRRRALRDVGGMPLQSCRDVGRHARNVISSLPSAEALMATATELSAVMPRAGVVIETSTLPIDVKQRARRRLQTRGIVLLDCPISGTGAQARTRDVVIYASGSRVAYRRVTTVLDAFVRAHHYVGPFGAGSKMKFVANLLVAIHNVATAEALVLARKAGLDPADVVRLVGEGAGSSRILQLRGPMMAKGDYTRPTMTLATWQKDVSIIAEFARRLGCKTPLFSTTAPIYRAAMKMGLASQDTAAVCAVLERMAGISGPSSRPYSPPRRSR